MQNCKSQRGLWLLFCAKGSEGDEDADADDSGDFGDIDGDGDFDDLRID